jgi:hypothetical protein
MFRDEETERWVGIEGGCTVAQASSDSLSIVEKYTWIYGSDSVFKLKGLSMLAGIYQTRRPPLYQMPTYETVVHKYEKIHGPSALKTEQAV